RPPTRLTRRVLDVSGKLDLHGDRARTLAPLDGQSVTLATAAGKLQLMSRVDPRAPGARLTGQGEARRLPDPPRSPAVWRIPPKWTNLIPALAGVSFFRPRCARPYDENDS